MYRLRLLWRGSQACSDCPNGFVCNDGPAKRFYTRTVDNRIQLACDDGFSLTRFPLLQCFTDTQYRFQAGIQSGFEPKRHVSIASP